MPESNFYSVLGQAIKDLSEHGFDREDRIKMWSDRLRRASEAMFARHHLEGHLRDALQSIYRRMIERGEITRYHYGVSRFTIQQLEPKLRAELNRRIFAATDLIKLRRTEATASTLSRFQAWATSINPGGTRAIDKVDTKNAIYKSLSQLDYVDRRLRIDQGYKLISSLNDIIAENNGAIAAEWNSHGKADRSYNARKDHLRRHGKKFCIRNNWAINKGLMKPGPNGYTDEIEQPGFFVYCRCWYRYIYNLSSLPRDMLTSAGKETVLKAQAIAKEI